MRCYRLGGALAVCLLSSSAYAATCTSPNLSPVELADPFGTINFLPLANDGGASVNAMLSLLNTTTTLTGTQGGAFAGSPANAGPGQTQNGIWVRGVGGQFDVSSTGELVQTLSSPQAPSTDRVANVNCATRIRQEFAGFQAGADVAKLNIGGWNVIGGITFGYTEANISELGGAFKGNFQAPFIGGYAVLTGGGGWFSDLLVRYDSFINRMSNPSIVLTDLPFHASALSISGSLGKNISLGSYFIEPSVAMTYAHLQTDSITTTQFAFPAGGPFVGQRAGGVASFDDVNSFLGRLGVRAGTSLTSGPLAIQPYVTASVWHEFAGASRSQFNATNPNFVIDPVSGLPVPQSISGTLSTSRIGTFGQVGLGASFQVADTGWLGYGRADYRFGENIQGYLLSGGLRYQFSPLLVAAGLPTKAPALPPPTFSWAGAYIGANVGLGWTQNWRGSFIPVGPNPTLIAPDTFNLDNRGIVGGGQIGYNFHVAPSWVIGFETDISATDLRKTQVNDLARSPPFPIVVFASDVNGVRMSERLEWLGTTRGRIGFAVDRGLAFLTGGLAYGRVNYDANMSSLAVQFPVSASAVKTGWAAGAGIEMGLPSNGSLSNWTAKAEYLYYSLGSAQGTSFGVPDQAPSGVRYSWNNASGNIVRLGLNYRFVE